MAHQWTDNELNFFALWRERWGRLESDWEDDMVGQQPSQSSFDRLTYLLNQPSYNSQRMERVLDTLAEAGKRPTAWQVRKQWESATSTGNERVACCSHCSVSHGLLYCVVRERCTIVGGQTQRDMVLMTAEQPFACQAYVSVIPCKCEAGNRMNRIHEEGGQYREMYTYAQRNDWVQHTFPTPQAAEAFARQCNGMLSAEIAAKAEQQESAQ